MNLHQRIKRKDGLLGLSPAKQWPWTLPNRMQDLIFRQFNSKQLIPNQREPGYLMALNGLLPMVTAILHSFWHDPKRVPATGEAYLCTYTTSAKEALRCAESNIRWVSLVLQPANLSLKMRRAN